MKTIGIISDTHGLLRPEALDALGGCSLILHAGDVGDEEILQGLAAIAPVRAVHGNTDQGPLQRDLPATLVVDLTSEDGEIVDSGEPVDVDISPSDDPSGDQGLLAYLLHDLDDLDLDPAAAGIAIVVTGHTHKPVIEKSDGVIYLNPGSAGPRRFDLPVTVAKVVVGGETVEVEIVELEV
jgi:hypothetical protein